MSEYCSQCSPFKPHFDIDLFEIAVELEKGKTEYFICEGCENRELFKDKNGELFLGKLNAESITQTPVKIEELM